MSAIEVSVGTASVQIAARYDRTSTSGYSTPHYLARDLADAAASALLAINTPDAIAYARALYEATKDAK